MKIKSTLVFNTTLSASHVNVGDAPAEATAAVLIGSALPNILRIPAGATIELPDSEWAQYAKAAEKPIKNGDLVLLKAPVLSDEEQEEADAMLEADLREQMKALKERRAEG